MNKRYEILKAIAVNRQATIDDLAESLPSLTRRQLIDNAKCAVDDGLLTKGRDDVTNLPLYTLTKLGRERLEAGPEKQIVSRKKAVENTQPAVVKNTGTQASVSLVEGGRHIAETSAEGQGSVEQPKPDDAPAAACSGDIPVPEYHPDELCFDAAERAKAMQDRAEKAEATIDSILSAARKFCGWVSEQDGGARRPLNLYECQKILGELFEDAADTIEKCERRIAELEANERLPLEIAPKPASTAVDLINHPPHYQGKVECIDAIESALGPVGFVAYCRGNAMKYTFRAGKKGDVVQDLKKAEWYLRRASA